MIPDHLIDKAAMAAYGDHYWSDDLYLLWGELGDRIQDEYRALARAVLEAVAADIWDEGYTAAEWNAEEVCKCAAWNEDECGCGNYGNGHRTKRNPYKEAA